MSAGAAVSAAEPNSPTPDSAAIVISPASAGAADVPATPGGGLERTALLRQTSAEAVAANDGGAGGGPQTPDVFVRRTTTTGLLRPVSSGGGDGGGAAAARDVGANPAIDAEAAQVAGEPMQDLEEEADTNCCGSGCPFFSAARLTLFVAFGGLVFLLTVGAIAYIAYSTSHFLADCFGLLIGVVCLGVCLTVVWSSCVALTCRAYQRRQRKQQLNEDADWYGAGGGPLSTRAAGGGGGGGGGYQALGSSRKPKTPRSGGSGGAAARVGSPGPVLGSGGANAGSPRNNALADDSKTGPSLLPSSSSRQYCACLKCCGRDRWPRLICGVFGALTILSTFFVFGALVALKISTLPGYDGTLNLPGLSTSGATKIVRESNGMIHIVAPNEHDLYFAQGVACAQERLWQMEFQRRVGSGRLSAAVGNVDTAIRVDELMRTVNFYGAAQSAFTNLDPITQAALQAYCDGVNAYLDTSPPIPLEFDLLGLSHTLDPWIPADLLVWTKLMSWQLSGNLDKELWRWDLLSKLNVTAQRIAELDPAFDMARFPVVLDPIAELNLPPSELPAAADAAAEEEPIIEWLAQWREKQQAKGASTKSSTASMYSVVIVLVFLSIHNIRAPLMCTATYLRENIAAYRSIFGTAQASNNWVIHGNRTTTGYPLLCNDPHLGLTAASVWILFDLQTLDGSYSAIGSSFVGTPGIVLGHNQHIAWGVTNTGADVQDLYVMIEPDSTPVGQQGTQYWYKGEWQNYTYRTEVIEIRHSDPRVLRVRETVYGPVLTDIQQSADDPDLSNPPLALHWTSLFPSDSTFEAFMGVAHATNFTDFTDVSGVLGRPAPAL